MDNPLMKKPVFPVDVFRPPTSGKNFISEAVDIWRMNRMLELLKTANAVREEQQRAILSQINFSKRVELETAKIVHEIEMLNLEKKKKEAEAATQVIEARLKENELKHCEVDLKVKLKNLDDILNGDVTE